MLNLSYRQWGKVDPDAKAKTDSLINASPNTDSLNRKPGTKPSHLFNDYAGVYANKGYGQAKIFFERDTAWIDYNEAGLRTKSYLQHYHYDVFRIRSTEETKENKDATKVKFNIDKKGEITSLEIQMEPSVKDIIFEKELKTKEISKEYLMKYEGDYTFPQGGNVKLYLKGETLYVFIEGQPEYELVASEKHKFFIKILPDYKAVFEVSESGDVISVAFQQPNGNFKAIKKK
jgi:hypothetical protein